MNHPSHALLSMGRPGHSGVKVNAAYSTAKVVEEGGVLRGAVLPPVGCVTGDGREGRGRGPQILPP
ncbi:hypothetical protein E2C01_040338 [Portunus trituberculatus]|uniref:Uncharacterized protein n=1 Tax=Portunus trituberculatus TaxID=210409 RepID=A0A5B7FME6_PORTR|nr:hypothetical protein [Portunus trituberculatus]